MARLPRAPWRSRTLRRVLLLAAISTTCLPLVAAPDIFPLSEVRAGQRGTGRTVFSGSKVEEFGVEILGVMRNIGPRQSVILARLEGGPLAETGVLQGMSGSPVYIDGRLVGAVALGFELAKEPIAGIRPIEEMLRVDPENPRPRASAAIPRQAFPVADWPIGDARPSGDTQLASGARLMDIATPVSFSGFSAAALEQFGPRLRELGLDPRQGVSGGGSLPDGLGNPSNLEPGAMISVQLLSGDMSVGADGTVTLVDDGKVYAFGHRLLAGGPSEMPFARSEVLALLPSLSSSFKISRPLEWIGTITEDRSVAISGVTGRRPPLTPLEIHVGDNSYRMNVVRDPVMTPLLVQMAVFSALDVTERAVGPATYHVRGSIDFEGGSVPIDNVYSGEVGVANVASSGIVSPLGYALASGFDALKLTGFSLSVDVDEHPNTARIASLTGPSYARPGDQIELSAVLIGEDGAATVQRIPYRIPIGVPSGPLSFTVADAATANGIEFQGVAGATFRSPAQVLDLLNGLRANTSAYLRVWRNEPTYTLEGRAVPDPPPSVALILGRTQPTAAATANAWGAQIDEIEIPGGGSVIGGVQTIRVEVQP